MGSVVHWGQDSEYRNAYANSAKLLFSFRSFCGNKIDAGIEKQWKQGPNVSRPHSATFLASFFLFYHTCPNESTETSRYIVRTLKCFAWFLLKWSDVIKPHICHVSKSFTRIAILWNTQILQYFFHVTFISCKFPQKEIRINLNQDSAKFLGILNSVFAVLWKGKHDLDKSPNRVHRSVLPLGGSVLDAVRGRTDHKQAHLIAAWRTGNDPIPPQ